LGKCLQCLSLKIARNFRSAVLRVCRIRDQYAGGLLCQGRARQGTASHAPPLMILLSSQSLIRPAFRTSICETLFLIKHCYYHHSKLTKIGELIRQIESMPQHFQALHSPTAVQRHCSRFRTHAGITDSATDDNMIVCSRERIFKIFLLYLAQLLTKVLL
jgi:hypothetical protein